MTQTKILIVDDERVALQNLERFMANEGYEVVTASNGATAIKHIESQHFDVVLTDLTMDKVDGMQVLKRCLQCHPDAEVIMITGFATLESAVNAMKQGAFHYIAKPIHIEELRKVTKEAAEKVALKKENKELRSILDTYQGKVKIITQNAAMLTLLETARQIAPTDCSIIIRGESGTGKELLVRYIHHHSAREGGPFFAINCGAFTDELLTNELFGHEKGAFTGAMAQKRGLIEMASGGTLFLDEVTEMSPSMQVKLLRVIQEREMFRVGATEPVAVDVRIISATNKAVREAIKSGKFRSDLYFRLNVVTMRVPPLSERKDDIAILSYHFLKKYATLMKKEVHEISKEVMDCLKGYEFPGNVRELENIIERAVALTTGKSVEASHLSDDLRYLTVTTFRRKDGNIPTLEEQERSYITWVLNEMNGNKTLAAKALGIDRVSLWRKLSKYGLDSAGE
ncbi:MAG: sigma-54 dependent transcriptional regulator [Candidatus Magnetominusculus sp. LBB02]|nr:sigma-54 dependent transcriptional regulator [Candidatus Magnetominusculus sp. LBB02]